MRLLFASVRARAGQPGTRWKFPWITAATAVAFVAIVIAVKQVAVTTGYRAASGRSESSAAVPTPVAPDRGVSASTAQAPRAEPVMPRADTAPTQPPARNRSLCSAANEAAGLCNPQ